MLTVLETVEETALADMLKDRQAWNSVFVNYHEPFVERLWRSWGAYRVFLHRIHPCEVGAALFHPHPWPSAMRVVDGAYEMGVGFGAGDVEPPMAGKFILKSGSSYEMIDPNFWHYARPLKRPAISLMVTGQPWGRKAPGSGLKLPPLTDRQQDRLFSAFELAYL